MPRSDDGCSSLKQSRTIGVFAAARGRRLARSASLLLLSVSAISAAGVLGSCNILGPALYFAAGPGKVDAQFTLDKSRPTAVFVDDRSSRVPARDLRTRIGDAADAALSEKRVVDTLLSSRLALGLAARDRIEQPMSITEIGKAIEAEVIIFATIDNFAITPDGQSYQPTVQMRVKVVDVTTGQRLWPEHPNEWATVVSGGPLRTGMPTTTTDRRNVQRDMAERAGLQLARLFFSYDIESSRTRVGGDSR